MKRVHSPNQTRKQAEESILRNIRTINKRRKDRKNKPEQPVDKEHVMAVLTRFIHLKKMTKN